MQVFEAVNQAKANGYSDILFLDASTGKYIEEVSSCNIFIVKVYTNTYKSITSQYKQI